jgi:hypothetical protein
LKGGGVGEFDNFFVDAVFDAFNVDGCSIFVDD